jgi:hypothetical protein
MNLVCIESEVWITYLVSVLLCEYTSTSIFFVFNLTSEGGETFVQREANKMCYNLKEIVKTLHVHKSSLQRLHKKYFPIAKLSIGGRPHKMTSLIELSYVKN